MSSLSEIPRALRSLRSSEEFMTGIHLDPELSPSAVGRYVFDMPFDGQVHDPTMINPLSVMEMVTDEKQVAVKLPQKSLIYNVIWHVSSSDISDRPWLQQLRDDRDRLSGNVAQAIYETRQPMDRVGLHYIGNTDSAKCEVPSGAKVHSEVESLEDSAEFIAEIAKRGLTFLISGSLGRLPLDSGLDWSRTIGAWISHKHETAYPAGAGKVDGHAGKKVDTNNPRKLKEANDSLGINRQVAIDRISKMGLLSTSIVFDKKQARLFDVALADHSIAQQVAKIRKNSR